jgi:GNAT superfamily N-acetyltransferase
MEVRPATPADAGAVAAIWHTGWHDGHDGNVPDELAAVRTKDTFWSRAAERVPETTVAVAGDEVAGFVIVAGDEVEQVYVSRAHRGSGVAAVLLAEAERQVDAAGHPAAWLAVATGNDRARRFTNAAAGPTPAPSTTRPPSTAARSRSRATGT